MKKNKALILLNMGGISNEQEVEIFLRNMFNDENIITTKSSLLRKFIANMIVFFRLKEAKKNYSYINFNSPLLKITKSLRSKLEKILPKHIVTFAMRYTYPFFSDTIKQIQKKKLKEIILFPMYPQYSTTTTKSSLDDALLYIEKYFPNAKITIVKRFYENKRFVKLVVDEIVKKIPKNSDISSYDLLFSAHSLPESIIKNGDSYEQEIQHNVHLLTNELKRRKQLPKDITIAYQSKLGPVKWLSPSLEYVLKSIPSNSKNEKKVIIYPISFTINNAEITYELDIMMKEYAKIHNIDEYIVCSVPNNSNKFAKIIKKIIS